MTRLIHFEIKNMPEMRVIGKTICPKMDMGDDNPVPAFWEKCFSDGVFKTLETLPNPLVKDYVGFMCDGPDKKTFTYICGMLFPKGTAVPEGFDYRDMPAMPTAVGWIQGPDKKVYADAYKLTHDEMIKQGFTLYSKNSYCMELYNCPRFTTPQPNGDVILDYYMPCQPKE